MDTDKPVSSQHAALYLYYYGYPHLLGRRLFAADTWHIPRSQKPI
jgi:hypothetical protein